MSSIRMRAGARWAVVAAMAAGAVFAGCGTVVDDSGGSTSSAAATTGSGGFQIADSIKQRIDDGQKPHIVVSYHDPSLAFAAPVKQGVEQAAKELDADVDFIGPAGGDADQQVNQIETLLAQGKVDGLAISAASNDALTPIVNKAVADGVPTISFNTDNPESDQLGFVGQDLKGSGRVEATELLKRLDGKTGKVVVFSVDTGAGWSADRFAGFKAGMAKADGIKLVGPVDTGDEPQQAYNKVENTMRANPDAIAIASLDCCSFTAAQRWVSENGKAGKIVVVGHDVLPATVKAIKGGTAEFTLSQNPRKQGYEAVQVLVDALEHGKPIGDVDTGIVVVDKGNIDETPVEG